MKAFFTKIIKTISAWSAGQKAIAAIVAVAGVSVLTASGILIYKSVNTEPVAQIEDTEAAVVVAVPDVEPETETETDDQVVVNLPEYKALGISTDSMEKDLNIYFTDDNKKKISGQQFSVKMVSTEDAKTLSDILAQIAELDEQIEACELSDEESDETESDSKSTSSASNIKSSEASDNTENKSDTENVEGTESTEQETAGGLSAEEFASLSEYEKLTLKKIDAIAEYKEAVEALDGKVFVDDDADGMIYEKNLESGDFVLCYIPTESYDPTNYTVKTTVKDKLEYVAVKNIKQKTVAYDASQDTNAPAAVVESVKANTIDYVNSSTATEYKETTDVAFPKAHVSTEMNTVEIEYQMASGNAPQESTGGTETPSAEAPSAETPGTETPSTEAPSTAAPSAVPSSTGTPGVVTNKMILSVPKTGVIYSGDVEANHIDNAVATVTGGTITSAASSSESLAVTLNADYTFSLVAADNLSAEETVTVTFTALAMDGVTTLSADCIVTVHPSTAPILDSEGNQLYLDAEGTIPATYDKYTEGMPLYGAVTKYYGWQTLDGSRYYFDSNGNKVTGKQVIEGQEYTFDNDGALLTSGYGIDVSKWQGNIDWNQVKTSASFAIIRAGFRGSSTGALAEDPKAGANIKGAKEAGLKVGLYFYSIAMNEAQAVEEASLAVAIANNYGGVSLPIYIDMEDSKQKGLSTAERDAIVMAFCRTVQSAGYSAGVYANKNWMTNYLTPSSYPGNISIWIARYNDTLGYDGRYDIWQYTSKGSVPGINGNVDMNISYF